MIKNKPRKNLSNSKKKKNPSDTVNINIEPKLGVYIVETDQKRLNNIYVHSDGIIETIKETGDDIWFEHIFDNLDDYLHHFDDYNNFFFIKLPLKTLSKKLLSEIKRIDSVGFKRLKIHAL